MRFLTTKNGDVVETSKSASAGVEKRVAGGRRERLWGSNKKVVSSEYVYGLGYTDNIDSSGGYISGVGSTHMGIGGYIDASYSIVTGLNNIVSAGHSFVGGISNEILYGGDNAFVYGTEIVCSSGNTNVAMLGKYNEINNAFSNNKKKVYYSVKANSNLSILKLLSESIFIASRLLGNGSNSLAVFIYSELSLLITPSLSRIIYFCFITIIKSF